MGGPRGQSEWARIKSPHHPVEPQTVQPIASCCIDHAVLAPGLLYYVDKHLHHALIISTESDVLYKLGVVTISKINFLLLLQHKSLVYSMSCHNCETRDSRYDL
jgi:hypothetical protein